MIIFGEPGTQKDMLAFLIHFQRKKQRGFKGQLFFVDSSTVSSFGVRVFGREKVKGLLEVANEGTLIFNNVHRLNKKLLPAVVQLVTNGTYWSKSSKEMKKSNLKVVLIAEDQFKELEMISKEAVRIKVPALRVRRDDIESIVKYQLRILSRAEGKQVPELEAQALKRLQAYDYPNNLQELFSMIENAWAHRTGSVVTADMLWTAQSPEKLDTFKARQKQHPFSIFVNFNRFTWFTLFQKEL